MYGLAKQNGTDNTPTLKRISFFGKNANIHEEVEFHSAYNGVKLGASNDGNLIGDDRTKFQDPSQIDITGIYDKLGLVKLGYKDLFQNQKFTASGYPDDTDLKMCEGHVRSGSTYTNKDGIEGAVYNICITNFDGSNAGWGDQELYRIAQCLNEGCGIVLETINLSGNAFSQGAINLLCTIIGPTAAPARRAAAAQHVKNVNPQ